MVQRCSFAPRNSTGISRANMREEIKIAKRETELNTKKETTGLSKAEKVELAMIKIRNSANLLSDIFDPHRHTIS